MRCETKRPAGGIGRDCRACARNVCQEPSEVNISSTCKVGQKFGVSLFLLTCSPSAWPSRLLYRRGQKSRRDLWITLYIECRQVSVKRGWQHYAFILCWCVAAVREVITGSTIKILRERIFASFSVPQAIIIDSAKCFVIHIFCDFRFTLMIQHITKPLSPTAIWCGKIQSDSQSFIDSLFQSLNLMGWTISLGTGAFTWVPMSMRHYHHC